MTTLSDTLSWDDVRLVKAVADARGLPGAAVALKLDQSTVFRRLGKIEQGLGARLFERRRSHYAATPSGEELIRIARDMEQEIETFARKVAGREISPAGEIRVATADSLLVHLLTPLLARFQQACPDVRLDMVVGNDSLNLSRRDADVAIRASNAPPDALVGRRVGRIAWALYGRRMDFPGTPERIRAEDLGERAWVSLSDDMGHMPVVRAVTSKIPARQLRYRTSTVLGLAEAIASGLGIGYAPCFVGDLRDDLVRLADPEPEFGDDLWLLTHPDLRHSPRIRIFLDFMAAELASSRTLIEGTMARPI
ncbi:MAG: lysR [Hyphomicrobiales bacterium]|nr:lysR [Hyphomicrobiales bacterium]